MFLFNHSFFATLITVLTTSNIAFAYPTMADVYDSSGGGFGFIIIPFIILAIYQSTNKILATVISVAIIMFCYYNPIIFTYIDRLVAVLIIIGLLQWAYKKIF